MKRFLFLVIGLASVTLLASGVQGGGKSSAWKPYLPDDAYKELTARSIKFIEEIATSGDKNAHEKTEVEAAILAAYTLSSKNAAGDAASSLRGASLQAAQSARKSDLKKLAAFGKNIATAPKAPAEIKDFTAYLQATEPMMKMFLSQKKGGEGIHPDLHYQVKLKNLNGIEALLSSLAGKKLNDENMAKVSKELPLLAYRLAAVGSITHELTPKKDVAKWREFSIVMRDESIKLAEGASKKNADEILRAATAVENSCIDCHSVFKNK